MIELLYLRDSIACRKEEIKRLRELAAELPSVDPSREFVSGSPTTMCKFSAIMDKVMDLEKEIAAEVEEYIEVERELREYIKKIENPTHRAFLWYRYIDCLTFAKIAEKMDMSERNMYNLQSATSFYFTDFHAIMNNRKAGAQ